MTELYTLKDISQEDLLPAIFQLEKKEWGKDPELLKKFAGLTPEQTLARYATKLGTTPEEKEVLGAEEAKAVGALLLQVEANNEKQHKIHPTIMVKTHPLEPKELSAWLQGNAAAGKNLSVEEWTAQHKVGLTGEPSYVPNGAEKLLIETHNGQRRVVGNGNLSEPINGYYGGVPGVTVGDGDLLDIYIANDVHAKLNDKEPYKGKIFVMQQMKKDGTPDEPKAGFAASAAEFKSVMTSTWSDAKKFETQIQGKYIELDYNGWQQFKAAVKEKPTLTVGEFADKEHIEMKTFEPAPPKKLGQAIEAAKGIGIALADDQNFWAPTGLPKQPGVLAMKPGAGKIG